MTTGIILGAGVFCLLLAALAGALAGRAQHLLSAAAGSCASLVLMMAGGSVMLQGQAWGLNLPLGHELLVLNLRLDALSAFFCVLLALVALPVQIYAWGYLQSSEYRGRNTGLIWTLTQLFILSMLGVVLANQTLIFLISWESMALLSFLLVISETRLLENRQAGFLYLLMTHIGTAALIGLFLLLGKASGSLVFSEWRALGASLPQDLKSGLFVLALFGFGAKAGLMPLHIWLPEAHPAAPGHVSALMSGVMLKIAVYGLLRILFEVLAPFPYGWGISLILLATVTALLGAVYAAESVDIKRLLAYSSIENIGLILLPIGVAMVCASAGLTALAALALVAALFHCLNHALFKSLLFLAAGAVVARTHTRRLDALGGLIKTMPRTAALFLIGALSLCAFPPLNGFVSEWLIFQSLLASYALPSPLLKLLAPVTAAVLGLIGALAAATLVKAFSTAFLALPRSAHARHATEASPSMQLGMALLAGACFWLGIQPAGALQAIGRVVATLMPGPEAALELSAWQLSLQQPLQAQISPPGLLLLGLLLLPLGLGLPYWLGRPGPVRREDTWSCGITPEARFEPTASGFQQPLQLVFGDLQRTVGSWWELIYAPLGQGLLWLSRRLHRLQSGNLNLYLAYLFLSLILTLLWVLK